MESPDNVLAGINRSLQDGWQASLNQDGRLFYTDHNSRISQWIPPPTCWTPMGQMPYGWEQAVDKNGKHYYINHVTCTTTREDPFDVEDIPPVEREVTLLRDMMLGFGFIAGSEKPVVVRSVTEGGPSVGKLLPGDKILRLNGEDVKMKDGPYIIERIRQSAATIRLAVIQPHIDKTGLKSSFLSANKKQKLKSRPSKVRFADNVKPEAVPPGKSPPSLVYLPSVLKVYLENGQTKSFKYDNKTSVKDVLRNLKEKLALRSMEHFSLVVQNMEESTKLNKYTILQDDETLTQIASRPGSQQWKCLLRVMFVPQDAYDLLNKDTKAFEYFYLQCCNDVINEKFLGELDVDKAVRLASLQIQQHFLSSKQSAKVSLKALEKEDSLERFLPPSITKKMKSKELKRLISHHIKQSQSLCAPGQKHLTELQAKLHYLKIVCDLRSFGGTYFTGTMVTNADSDSLADYNCTVLVGPKCGITQVLSLKDNVMSLLADYSQLTDIQLSPMMVNGDCLRVELHVKNEKPIVLLLTHDDAYDMVTLVNGYYRLFVDINRSLLPSHYSHTQETEAPVYRGKHRVISAEWNYPKDLASELISGSVDDGGQVEWRMSGVSDGEFVVDLSCGPPAYEEDVAYINRLKAEGRFHAAEASGGRPDGAVMSFTIHEEDEDEDVVIHTNTNNSQDVDNSISPGNDDDSLDLTPLSDMVEEMFEMPKVARDENKQTPQESRQEMTIDGSDERKDFLEEPSKPEGRKSQTRHFDVTDAVAIHPPPEDERSDGQVQLLHYAIYNDNSLIPVREIQSPIEDDREKEQEDTQEASSIPLKEDDVSEPTTKLIPQDSVVLAHKKQNDKEQDDKDESERAVTEESFRNLSSYSNSSVDSDIVDLTQPSFTDVSPGENAPFSRSDLVIPPFDLSEVYAGETDNESNGLQSADRDTSESPVPVSIIDLPSPDPEPAEETSDPEPAEETSDQAHGIQLAALDAINLGIDQKEDILERSVHREPECESDSGNETISSEIIDNGVSDEPGASHSPSDYFSMIGQRRSTVVQVDRDPTPTPEHNENENAQEHDSTPQQSNSFLESDTDSISTLHGSSPNLSAIDASERASDTPDQQLDTNENENSIEDLIASLIIPPPPPLESDELDEELLSTVIPPPPVSDFDIGVIESLIVPPPPKSPASSPPITPSHTPVATGQSSKVVNDKSGGKVTSEDTLVTERKSPAKPTDVQIASPNSPGKCSPLKLQKPSPLKSLPSPTHSSPTSPVHVSPSLAEPTFSCAKERSRPKRISSSMMSSSQDSGFCQLGPGDLDHQGAVFATYPDDVKEQTLDEDQSECEDGCESKPTELKDCHLIEEDLVNEDLRDQQTSNDETGQDQDAGDDKEDSIGTVEPLKTVSDVLQSGTDKVSIEADSKSLQPLEITSAQVEPERPFIGHPAPRVPPKPAVRPKVTRQQSLDCLSGGDFDTSGPPDKLEQKKISPKAPEPPPRKRYSPGLAKKAFPAEKTVETWMSNGMQRSTLLKLNQVNGEYLKPFEESFKTGNKSSHSQLPDEKPHEESRREDANLGPEITGSEQRKNEKIVLNRTLSEDSEMRQGNEAGRPVVRSNTFSAGSSSDGKKTKRQAPPPPPKPIRLKQPPASAETPLSPKEKQRFRNTISASSPSSIAKLLSPKRSFSFLRGAKPFSKSSSKADDSVLPSSTTKEKKEFRRPRPLRAFRSLSRKDSYDVSMLDHKKDRSGEPSFKESSSLRSVGGLQRPDSLNLGDNTSDVEKEPSTSVSRRVSLYETKSKSEESERLPASAHKQRRLSQSLGRATGRPVSYPSSPQKYPGPGSIHASLPKRPPPPRPNHPPASPRKAMYPSDESLSSSSSEVLPSPVPSPSGYDQDSTDSDDLSSPPPLPVSLPPVKSRPRALPEHFIPPPSFKTSKSSLVAPESYLVELESKEYQGKHSVPEALSDVQLLISELQTFIQAEESSPSLKQFRLTKESLISEVREFTSNTKMLVSSAGQSEEQLMRSMNSSMHTLARLGSDSQQLMKAMVSLHQATNLGNKIKDVATNFSNILSAATQAHGKTLNDPTMQMLLRQAQIMAAVLSALMRSLRMLQS